jgi:two-component system CheB/CheR fusion protein
MNPTPSQAAASRVYRILVVEDNLDAVHSTCALLWEMGHNADYAINGYVAVDLARRLKPDVLILDLGLPGLSGFDVLERLRADPELEKLRVIVVTAYSEPEYMDLAKQLGCEAFLVKPVSPKELARILGEPKRAA